MRRANFATDMIGVTDLCAIWTPIDNNSWVVMGFKGWEVTQFLVTRRILDLFLRKYNVYQRRNIRGKFWLLRGALKNLWDDDADIKIRFMRSSTANVLEKLHTIQASTHHP